MSERVFRTAPSTGPMFLRAGLAAVPGISALPIGPGSGRGRGSRATRLPDSELVLLDVEVDRDHLAAYDRVCGFRYSDRLPSTYLHVLAFPLHMALITDPRFPFPAAGLVHIENRITQHRVVGLGERLSFRVRTVGPAPHRRGVQFTLVTEARVGMELVWVGESVNLRRQSAPSHVSADTRGKGATVREGAPEEPAPVELAVGQPAPDDPSAGAEQPLSEDLPANAEWRLPADLGRRYAAVAGDHNPIHLHPLTARLFGFPTAIAHGMWTKARVLAALEGRLPDAYTVEVAFKKPILLPGRVAFAERAGDGEERGGRSGGHATELAVRDARRGTPHLVGRVLAD